jgi:hypothetical protein
MAHKCDYFLRFEIENENELVLINQACYKQDYEIQDYKYKLDIYKYNLTTKKAYVRYGNVHYVNLGGWLVDFPNEKCKTRYGYYYGYNSQIPLCDYEETSRINGLEYGRLEMSYDRVKDLFLKSKPELKYLLNKIDFYNPRMTIWKLLDLIDIWYLHPSEVETLAYLGFYNIATNKSLYRLGKAKKKEIINALKYFNDDRGMLSLITIQNFIKSGMKYEEWYTYMCWNNWRTQGRYIDDIETFRYCQRKNIDKYRYHDMLAMASNQGHDIEDDYWKYPNDPNAMHDRLLETKQELERIEREKELEREKQYWLQLKKIAVKNKLDSGVDLGNGYTLFMPYEYEQYKKSADELHQCILASKYYSKVAQGKSLLIMIWHDGKPSSTCEIDFDKKILQHYGNELNREDCKPTEFEQEAIKKFLATFKPKKVAFKEVQC